MDREERISDRVRSVGDGLILGFPIEDTTVESERIETVRLYFFRVGSETRYFQRYTQLSDLPSGNTNPTNNYDYLGDTGVGTGEDIFRVETDDWHIMHFGFATNNPNLQVFTAISPESNGNPAQDRTGQDEDIVPGTDDRGWFSQAMISDQFDPPSMTELVAFKNGEDRDGEFLQWAFYNDGPNTLSGGDLTLFFSGRGYKLQPVVDAELRDIMLQTAFADLEETGIDTIFHQVGGVNRFTLGTEEPDSWRRVRTETDAFTQVFNVDEIGPPWGTDALGRGGGGRRETVQVRNPPQQ